MVRSRQNSRLEQSLGRLITSRLPSIGGGHLLAAIGVLLALGGPPASYAATAADEAHERYLADFEAACPPPPEPPELPDGVFAGRDDMVDAMKAVKAFDAATAAFAECVRTRLAVLQAGPGLTDADGAQLTGIAFNLTDGAIAGSERLAAAFNHELQQFKARPQDKVGRRYVRASMREIPEDLASCYPASMPRHRLTIDVRVDVDGGASLVETPTGADDGMINAARCVTRKIRLNPAARDGVPEESFARMPVTFGVEDAGDWVTPTLLSTDDEFVSATLACYPAELGINGPRGRLTARLTLTPFGNVRLVKVLTSAGNPALDKAGRCIARKLRFTPLRVNGLPRDSDVVWEIPVRPPAAWIANPPAAQSP